MLPSNHLARCTELTGYIDPLLIDMIKGPSWDKVNAPSLRNEACPDINPATNPLPMTHVPTPMTHHKDGNASSGRQHGKIMRLPLC
jgi:hypothetical protein